MRIEMWTANTRYIILLAALGIATSSIGQTIRPFEIQVVDVATRTPLPEVILYYQLNGARPKHFLGIPLIEPIIYRYLVQECYRTDSNGYVRIPPRTVRLKLYEKVLSEYIYINLDVASGTTPELRTIFQMTYQDTYCNPLSTHDGALIWSTRHDPMEPGWTGTRTNGTAVFTAIMNKNSLALSSDRMTIELHRKK